MRNLLSFLLLFLTFNSGWSQVNNECTPTIYSSPLSPRTTNYIMDINFDHDHHQVIGTERIEWINRSPDSVSHVRMYMYINAFSGPNTSYLRRSNTNVTGQSMNDRTPEEWGSIHVDLANQISHDSKEELTDMRYVQPDDDNKEDQTVLDIQLEQVILPGDTLYLDIAFTSKLPRTVVRTGYGEHDFNHFVHWYPKLGVYEQDIDGNWDWNCHQFLRQMEFYGDHGNYNVTIEYDEKFVVGGSGCRDVYKEEILNKEGRVITRFIAHDVIDFGWVASPILVELEDKWEHVDIRLLHPPGHKSIAPRLITAAKQSLEYFKKHLGEYPYNTLTILDPPLHGLRSGFMEYPTYITGGGFCYFPKGVRSLESLIVHEFSHQYFMQMLASNEKEAPWLDEGFVTFYEDCIMEDAYGKSSLIDLLGYRVGNSALTRNEYASLPNPRISPIAINGWKVKGAYKSIIYAKTATVLRTLKGYLGADHFEEMMKSYFEKNKFTHPRREHFVSEVRMAFELHPNLLSPVIDHFLIDVLDDTKVCDYAVRRIGSRPINTTAVATDDDNSKMYQSFATLERKGDLIVPLEVKFVWSDGSVSEEIWNGKESIHTITLTKNKKLQSVEIDPDRKMFLDLDFNNNSYTLDPDKGGILKYALRSIYWVQNAIQSTSFLM